MATTITMPTLTDDTGSAANPNADGTILNNSWFQNQLKPAIDAMFSSGTFALGGLLTVSGFGISTFIASGTGGNSITIKNTAAGTSNFGQVAVASNTVTGAIYSTSSTFTAAGITPQAGTVMYTDGTGGLSVAATHASGTVRFYAGGTTEWVRLSVAGGFGLKDAIAAPATVAGFALLYVDTADGDLKVKFGDGTVKTIATNP